MTDKTDEAAKDSRGVPTVVSSDAALVTRSAVPADLKYGDYKQYLRRDFFHSCAYCTMSEAEAQAIRFTIDHYEPRYARKDLEHAYSNLMYACDECNLRKGDRYPPPDARAAGHRFFRPDQDKASDHFTPNGKRIDPKSPVGDYTITALDLNRLALRKLRELRKRLTECDELVSEGVRALRAFHIDRLPAHVKGRALSAIADASKVAEQLAEDIDAVLREYARSDMIEPDLDSEERAKERSAKLEGLKILFPGNWRAPRKKRGAA